MFYPGAQVVVGGQWTPGACFLLAITGAQEAKQNHTSTFLVFACVASANIALAKQVTWPSSTSAWWRNILCPLQCSGWSRDGGWVAGEKLGIIIHLPQEGTVFLSWENLPCCLWECGLAEDVFQKNWGRISPDKELYSTGARVQAGLYFLFTLPLFTIVL